MAGVVADTHAVLWYIFDDPHLSSFAATVMQTASITGDPIHVPTVCLIEATYLMEKGKVPVVALDRLTTALRSPDSGFRAAPLDLAVALHLRRIPRSTVPDMPDRIIAATAAALSLPLVTRDGRIRAANVTTIW